MLRIGRQAAVRQALQHGITLQIIGEGHRSQQHRRTIDPLRHSGRSILQAVHGQRLLQHAARQAGAEYQQDSRKTQQLVHYPLTP
ncbi:hypothetical protein D3C77_583760 [compost metagenome]